MQFHSFNTEPETYLQHKESSDRLLYPLGFDVILTLDFELLVYLFKCVNWLGLRLFNQQIAHMPTHYLTQRSSAAKGKPPIVCFIFIQTPHFYS